MEQKKKTLKELAQDALAVQDASNLCGVAQSFARAMIDLGSYTGSTYERNWHCIVTVWLDKMNSLNGIQEYSTCESSKKIQQAYIEVEKLVEIKIEAEKKIEVVDPDHFKKALNFAKTQNKETKKSFKYCLKTINRIKRRYGPEYRLYIGPDFVEHSFSWAVRNIQTGEKSSGALRRQNMAGAGNIISQSYRAIRP